MANLARDLVVAAVLGLACGVLLGVLPAHAGDNAPGAALWTTAGDHEVSVPMGELPHCAVTGDCCSTYTPCSVAYDRVPDPAPVPLPPAGLMLAAALGLLWRMRCAE